MHQDTAYQSSDLACHNLSLSCLRYFWVSLPTYISCQLSSQKATLSWPQKLMPCTTWNGQMTSQYTDRANTYKQVGQFPIKTGWRDSPLVFCNLAKAFKHNTICDSSGIQTHNHLVPKRTLNYFAKLAKWLTCFVSTYLYGIHLNFRYRACLEEVVFWN